MLLRRELFLVFAVLALLSAGQEEEEEEEDEGEEEEDEEVDENDEEEGDEEEGDEDGEEDGKEEIPSSPLPAQEDASTKILSVLRGDKQKSVTSLFRSGNQDSPNMGKYVSNVKNLVATLPCHKDCSIFEEHFDQDVETITKILIQLPPLNGTSVENNLDSMLSVSAGIKEMTSSDFFNRVNVRALLNRNDTIEAQVPGAWSLTPEYILPKTAESVGTDYQGEVSVDFEYKSPLIGTPESALDYFREDHRLHAFHSDWHIMSPALAPNNRKYERFAYMHKLLLNRYKIERHVNGLPDVEPLDIESMKKPIADSAYPNSQFTLYSATKANCLLPTENVTELEQRLQRAQTETAQMALEQFKYYVEVLYHNYGHFAVSQYCREDTSKPGGFLINPYVSARDPLFYRWHEQVENILKIRQEATPYTATDLSPAQGIVVTSLQLKSRCSEPNRVETFYSINTMQVNFTGTGNSEWSTKMLDHEHFSYIIRLQNQQNQAKKVILRIFLLLEEYMPELKSPIELDRFVYQLKGGGGEETVERKSTESSLADQNGVTTTCAWPYNLLLPAGKKGDAASSRANFRLVVFVNDIPQEVNEGETEALRPAMLCGLRSHLGLVMDSREHGFPFDRKWSGVDINQVLNNNNPTYGKISAKVEIIFSVDKAPQCPSSGAPPADQPAGQPNTTSSSQPSTNSSSPLGNRASPKRSLPSRTGQQVEASSTSAPSTGPASPNSFSPSPPPGIEPSPSPPSVMEPSPSPPPGIEPNPSPPSGIEPNPSPPPGIEPNPSPPSGSETSPTTLPQSSGGPTPGAGDSFGPVTEAPAVGNTLAVTSSWPIQANPAQTAGLNSSVSSAPAPVASYVPEAGNSPLPNGSPGQPIIASIIPEPMVGADEANFTFPEDTSAEAASHDEPFLLGSGHQPPPVQCSHEYFMLHGVCYLLGMNPKNYEQAERFCNLKRGRLVDFDADNGLDRIIAITPSYHPGSVKSFWIRNKKGENCVYIDHKGDDGQTGDCSLNKFNNRVMMALCVT